MCAHGCAIHIYPGLVRLCLAIPEKPCLNLPADDVEKVSATRYIDYVVGTERERGGGKGGRGREREREREYVGVNQSNAERAKHVEIEQQNSSRCAGIYAEICEYITHPPLPLSIAHNRRVRCNSVGRFFAKIRENWIHINLQICAQRDPVCGNISLANEVWCVRLTWALIQSMIMKHRSI